MSGLKKCSACPTPMTPFHPELCMSCAVRYCKTHPRGCGQNCPGCRAQVAYADSAMVHPPKPHYKCGQFHAYGTPCPNFYPPKPHYKCGKFHPYRTPCPEF